MPLDDTAPEMRSIENPAVPISQHELFQQIIQTFRDDIGAAVTPDMAMTVPAYSSAVNFLTKTVAKLPLHVMKRKTDKTVEREGATVLNGVLHDQVNDEMSSYKWRKHGMYSMLNHGRWISYIERNAAGQPINIFSLDPTKVTIKRVNLRTTYEYRSPGKRTKVYAAQDIIDIPWMVKSDPLEATSPLTALRGTVGLEIAVANYGGGLFKNGGVPPLSLEGMFNTGKQVANAKTDVTSAIQQAAKDGSPVLPLPFGYQLKAVGFNPEDAQMVELQKFLIVEIARGFTLPPVFLQDLTHGTFTNTEQQDLFLVKHTLSGIIAGIEAELNLKLFSRGNRTRFARFNLDGLLRGDFSTRMTGYQKALQSSAMTPQEIREREKLSGRYEGDDTLYVQGAIVPLEEAGRALVAAPSGEGDAGSSE